MLDAEVRKMITLVFLSMAYRGISDRNPFTLNRTAHRRTTDLLTKHKADVEKVAKRLLEKEVLTRSAP
jgi:ATP-dependent Zn protease